MNQKHVYFTQTKSRLCAKCAIKIFKKLEEIPQKLKSSNRFIYVCKICKKEIG